MGMAKNTDVRSHAIEKRSPFRRECAACIQNVADGNPKPCELDHRLNPKTALLISINIAGNRRHRSDGLQLIDDSRLADITAMHDMIGMLEMTKNCRIEQTMCVGDDSDTNWPWPAHEAEPDDAPKTSRTLGHSNENGSGVCFGISASRALR